MEQPFQVYKKKSTLRKERKDMLEKSLDPKLYLEFVKNLSHGRFTDYTKIVSLTTYENNDEEPEDIYVYSEIFSVKKDGKTHYYNFLRNRGNFVTKKVFFLERVDSDIISNTKGTILNMVVAAPRDLDMVFYGAAVPDIVKLNILLFLYSLKLSETSLISLLPLDILKEIIRFYNRHHSRCYYRELRLADKLNDGKTIKTIDGLVFDLPYVDYAYPSLKYSF